VLSVGVSSPCLGEIIVSRVLFIVQNVKTQLSAFSVRRASWFMSQATVRVRMAGFLIMDVLPSQVV
jgi:hypothetical protein